MPSITELGDYLEQHAKNGTVIWYTELYDHFNIPKEALREPGSPIILLLARLVSEDRRAGRPLRASVVVAKEKDRDKSKLIPADSYFKALCKTRNIPMPRGKVEKREMHAIELAALRKYYGFQSNTNV